MKPWQFIFLILFPLSANAQSIDEFIPAKPVYPRMYNDEMAYAYYHKDWRKLEDKLINHQKKTGKQLVIIMVPSLHGRAIEEIALHTFRNWGIGDKKNNTGLLILIAREEKKIKIEIGYGLEGEVTDMESAAIIYDILEPGLVKYNFLLPPAREDKGYLLALEKAIDALIRLTKDINPDAVQNAATLKNNTDSWKRMSLVIYIIAAITFFCMAKAGWRLLNNKLSNK